MGTGYKLPVLSTSDLYVEELAVVQLFHVSFAKSVRMRVKTKVIRCRGEQRGRADEEGSAVAAGEAFADDLGAEG
jgi:hypothetical protein